nr:MAG TPA: hypothetical protein [Caudoviricetes sp.]
MLILRGDLHGIASIGATKRPTTVAKPWVYSLNKKE